VLFLSAKEVNRNQQNRQNNRESPVAAQEAKAMGLSRRLQQALEAKQVRFQMEEHDVAYTAQEVAAATHVRGKEMVKTVIVIADGKHVMVAAPASRRVDLPTLKKQLGAESVRLAEESEFAADFPDCELGAMPPFGNLYDLPLIAAEALREDDEIVFNAGNHREIVRMKRADWETITQPRWIRCTRPLA
jgi:Ala-tRNA(Pro) deacylase